MVGEIGLVLMSAISGSLWRWVIVGSTWVWRLPGSLLGASYESLPKDGIRESLWSRHGDQGW